MNAQFGMIGLGTMGRNFLLNVAQHGFSCVGFDLDAAKRVLLLEEGRDFDVTAAENLPDFVASLESPRKVMLLVPAGPIVDAVIADLIPLLAPGDLIIDGGNSHFTDTERREKLLAETGIEFLGVGVSGGEEGARHGASIMIGGKPEVYEHVRPMLEAASAKVNGEPCAAHVGNGSAGHFVKMVHNGIEYGMMQLISEVYDLMKRGYGMDAADISDHFAAWDKGELSAFLIEITATVLKKTDATTKNPLTEMILDTAGQKGTGKWTSQAAMDLGVPIPTIDSAVTMRQISAQKELRVAMSKKYASIESSQPAEFNDTQIKNALYTAFVAAYAQGFSMLGHASAEKNFDLDMVEIAKIWRGGCIIRAALLEKIRTAFTKDPALPNLLLDDSFAAMVSEKLADLSGTIESMINAGIPSMCSATSFNYIRAFSTARLPANLIQAQRDYFGAHTYQRIDEPGTFHTPDWDEA